MSVDEQISPVQSALQRIIVIAAAICFASTLLFYLGARPLIERLQVVWAEWIIYASIPIAVTFMYLRHSAWHQEITGAKRTCSLLLLAGAIFGGVLATIGILAAMAWFISIAVPVGSGVR